MATAGQCFLQAESDLPPPLEPPVHGAINLWGHVGLCWHRTLSDPVAHSIYQTHVGLISHWQRYVSAILSCKGETVTGIDFAH